MGAQLMLPFAWDFKSWECWFSAKIRNLLRESKSTLPWNSDAISRNFHNINQKDSQQVVSEPSKVTFGPPPTPTLLHVLVSCCWWMASQKRWSITVQMRDAAATTCKLFQHFVKMRQKIYIKSKKVQTYGKKGEAQNSMELPGTNEIDMNGRQMGLYRQI